MPDLTLAEKIKRTSQAPANSGAPDCCKVPGSLTVTFDDAQERFTGTCPTCGRRHRRAFVDLGKLNATINGIKCGQ